MNPIRQLMHPNGALRGLPSASKVNYGAFPQTWSDPKIPAHGFYGDGDPLDVLEIGQHARESGDIVEVKVLGCLGLLDKGELDWKIITLDVRDPLAAEVNTLEDAKRHFPVLAKIRHYCLTYRAPHINSFLHEEEFLDAKFTIDLISSGHKNWRKLMSEDM